MPNLNIQPAGIYFHTTISSGSQSSSTENPINDDQADGQMVMAVSSTERNVTVVILTTNNDAMMHSNIGSNTQYASLGNTPPINGYPAFKTSIDAHLGDTSYLRIIGPITFSINHLRPIRKWASGDPPHMMKNSWHAFCTLFSTLNTPQPYESFPSPERDDFSTEETRIKTRNKQHKRIMTEDAKPTYAAVTRRQLTEEMLEETQIYIDLLREDHDISWMMNRFLEELP
jgi:hypothetical protein